MKRVVITGVGAYTPNGCSSDELFNNLKNGVSSIDYLDQDIKDKTSISVASYFKDYDPKDHFSKKEIRSYDLVNQYAILAAREAYKNANLDDVQDRDSIGCNITSGIGGLTTIEEEISKANKHDNFSKISPMFVPKSIINLVAGNVAIDLNLHGICNSVVTACASSTDAIGHALMYINNSMADVMVTGGSEACINLTGISGFKNIGALTKSEDKDNACISFDENRNGFVMGEGSVSLVLEEYNHAINRGAKILGEVVSYASFCDASHITAPDPNGVGFKKAINTALSSANIDASDIDFVNAHGTSTPLNDISEARVLNEIFGSDIKVTSSKTMTGHMLGAAGAMEALACVLGIDQNIITPTINTKNIDPEINVDVITKTHSDTKLSYCMSTSLGFGGHNSVLIFKGVDNANI